MSAATCSNSASFSRSPVDSFEEDMSAESAAKRAKIEIPSFSQLNLQEFTLKTVGQTKKDFKFYANISGAPIRANLTPTDWMSIRFGFDLSGKYEKPSFLGGSAPERLGCPESLSIKVTLNAAQMEFLKKLDEAAENALSDIMPCKWNRLITPDMTNASSPWSWLVMG